MLPVMLAQARLGILEFEALFVRPPVVPQDGRPDGPVGGIEKRGAVHLSRQAYSRERREGAPLAIADLLDGVLGGLPPVARVLLRPAAARPRHAQCRRRAVDEFLPFVDQDGFDRRRAYVDAEEGAHALGKAASRPAFPLRLLFPRPLRIDRTAVVTRSTPRDSMLAWGAASLQPAIGPETTVLENTRKMRAVWPVREARRGAVRVVFVLPHPFRYNAPKSSSRSRIVEAGDGPC